MNLMSPISLVVIGFMLFSIGGILFQEEKIALSFVGAVVLLAGIFLATCGPLISDWWLR